MNFPFGKQSFIYCSRPSPPYPIAWFYADHRKLDLSSWQLGWTGTLVIDMRRHGQVQKGRRLAPLCRTIVSGESM